MDCEILEAIMGCEKAELPLILEAIEERIELECGERIPEKCYKIIHRVINNMRGHGKEYVRAKYGI